MLFVRLTPSGLLVGVFYMQLLRIIITKKEASLH